jgi:hypothetical protein
VLGMRGSVSTSGPSVDRARDVKSLYPRTFNEIKENKQRLQFREGSNEARLFLGVLSSFSVEDR